jgi:hypothetical protein
MILYKLNTVYPTLHCGSLGAEMLDDQPVTANQHPALLGYEHDAVFVIVFHTAIPLRKDTLASSDLDKKLSFFFQQFGKQPHKTTPVYTIFRVE